MRKSRLKAEQWRKHYDVHISEKKKMFAVHVVSWDRNIPLFYTKYISAVNPKDAKRIMFERFAGTGYIIRDIQHHCYFGHVLYELRANALKEKMAGFTSGGLYGIHHSGMGVENCKGQLWIKTKDGYEPLSPKIPVVDIVWEDPEEPDFIIPDTKPKRR